MQDNYIGFIASHMGFDAHLTVMYTGPLSDEQKASIGIFLSNITTTEFVVCSRWEIAMFGPDNNIPVLRVIPTPYLWYLRRQIEKNEEIPKPSAFTDWNPHITLPDFGLYHKDIVLPSTIQLEGFGIH
jgi:hypothetical protein